MVSVTEAKFLNNKITNTWTWSYFKRYMSFEKGGGGQERAKRIRKMLKKAVKATASNSVSDNNGAACNF